MILIRSSQLWNLFFHCSEENALDKVVNCYTEKYLSIKVLHKSVQKVVNAGGVYATD